MQHRAQCLFLLLAFGGRLTGFTAVGAAAAKAASAIADDRPNILLLITDDQRFDQMGNLNPLLHTPEMDRLVRECGKGRSPGRR